MTLAQIKTGKTQKVADGVLKITFDGPFKDTPTVCVSSFWHKEKPESVSKIETIVSVDKFGFEVYSNNYHPKDYFVSWIAILDAQPV